MMEQLAEEIYVFHIPFCFSRYFQEILSCSAKLKQLCFDVNKVDTQVFPIPACFMKNLATS